MSTASNQTETFYRQ